jgi:hypothetical protein
MANGGLVTPPQPQPQGYNEDEIELAQAAIDYDALLARMDEMEAYRVKSYRYMYQLYLAESEDASTNMWACREYFLLCSHAVIGFSLHRFFEEFDKNPNTQKRVWEYYDNYPLWFFLPDFIGTFDYPEFNIKRFPFVPKQVDPARFYEYSELRALATNPNADQTEKDLAFAMLSESLADFEMFKAKDYDIFKSVSLLSVSKPELFSEKTAYFHRFDYILRRLGRNNFSGYYNSAGYGTGMSEYADDNFQEKFSDILEQWVVNNYTTISITIRKLDDKYLFEILTNATSDNTKNIYTGVVKYHSDSMRDKIYERIAWLFLKEISRSLVWMAFGARSKQDIAKINKVLNSLEDAQIRKVKEVIFNLQLKTINYK